MRPRCHRHCRTALSSAALADRARYQRRRRHEYYTPQLTSFDKQRYRLEPALLETAAESSSSSTGPGPPRSRPRLDLARGPLAASGRLRLSEGDSAVNTPDSGDWSRRPGVGAAALFGCDLFVVLQLTFALMIVVVQSAPPPGRKPGRAVLGGPADLAVVPRASMAYSASTKRRWPPPRSWLMTRRLRRPKAYWRRSTPRSTEVGPCHESAVQAQPPCCAPVRGANNASCLQLLLHAVGHARERCPGAWRGGQRGQVAPPSTCG